MHDPSVAKGSILGLLENIHENGAILGGVGFKGRTDDWFIYHANYAKGILQIHQIHPDSKFLEQVYEPLAKYAEYFDRERDPEGCNLYDVTQQYETGQSTAHGTCSWKKTRTGTPPSGSREWTPRFTFTS
ncbi:MAG: hypothetical protein Q6352_011785 [Candidatus Freyrarchaeum guaymaensis]|nr:hypothetical protein [Candidatus Sigynarchaeota archaeon]